MPAIIEHIYVAASGGTVMRECAEIQALAGRGLEGDRYCERRGYWTNVDECQVTLIAAEDLDAIA
ncbi:MAG: MOSC domain-containing protein, partial [Alphaproteobacteria bacterium]|nr:MOSC domain-containing protein [Alphaproteobacteria bacterium]